MDWLQFFASVIRSLAWPAAIVLIVLLLRRELVQILRRLRRFKYGDAEAEFEEVLEEVEEEIEELPAPKSSPPEGEFRRRYLKELDRFSNNSAIFIAWLEVESAILNLARRANLLETNMNALRAAHRLIDQKIIDEATYNAIGDLWKLRNIAVHPTDIRQITKEEAERFRKLADKVAASLGDRTQALG
jgi:uncharacterized protein YutE (UPF0331/DUF86 family)